MEIIAKMEDQSRHVVTNTAYVAKPSLCEDQSGGAKGTFYFFSWAKTERAR